MQTTLTFEPKDPKRVRRTRFFVGRNRLPWRQQIDFLNGDSVTLHLTYEAHGEVMALQAIQHHFTPATPKQPAWSVAERLTYQRVGPYLLLASVDRQTRDLSDAATGKTEFLAVKVDSEVPEFHSDQ